MNEPREKDWSQVWHSECEQSYVMIQHAQRTNDGSRGEKALRQWQTEHHVVWEAKGPLEANVGRVSAGVAILAPKEAQKIKAKYTPKKVSRIE